MVRDDARYPPPPPYRIWRMSARRWAFAMIHGDSTPQTVDETGKPMLTQERAETAAKVALRLRLEASRAATTVLAHTPAADSVHGKVLAKMEEAERKAWLSLAGYKFVMFGYWAGQWVLCKCLLPHHVRNPFATLVRFAKDECVRRGWLGRTNETEGNDNGDA